MKTLYIIGNGFDLAHDLDTSYWAFRTFLNDNNETQPFLRSLEDLYGVTCWNDDTEVWEERAKKILWREFEDNLQYANDGEMEDMSIAVVRDMVTDDGEPMYDIRETLNIYWEPYYQFIGKLNEYVEKWVNTIDISKVDIKCKNIYRDKQNYYFTFNYTEVLEEIYKIDEQKLLHIHGSVNKFSTNTPIMGHGGKQKIEEYNKILDKAEKEYDEAKASIYSAMTNFYEASLKDVEGYIEENDYFFKKLCGVECVKVIGHSLSDVDMPYYKKIRASVMPNAQWIFYVYNAPDDTKEQKQMKKQEILNKARFLRIKRNKIKILDSQEFWK